MRVIISALTALSLAACTSGGGLRDLNSNSGGPDEFSVVPGAPLTLPETLVLPTPTRGGVNRTDANPIGQAIAALGGNQARSFAGGVPSRDAALVAAVSRNGVTPDIRATLAREDAALRARASRLNVLNWIGRDKYFGLYAHQALDANAELIRWRNAGAATPSAPPQ